MFANIGYGYKPGKFEGIFQRAQELVRGIFCKSEVIVVVWKSGGLCDCEDIYSGDKGNGSYELEYKILYKIIS